MKADPVVCVVGPTASGKTSLAQKLAIELDGEVVSADSMQIYRGMDIGTGKLPQAERVVPHHGLDLIDPGEPFSAALFQSYARGCFDDIAARDHRSILTGGTGFYVRAAIDTYDFPEGGQTGNPLRERCDTFVCEHGAQALWELLAKHDRASAALIPPGDVRRVVRAFELLEGHTTYAEQRAKLATLPQLIPAYFIGLAVEPEILRNRIDERVDAMLEEGLVDEVTRLLHLGFREGITAPQAIGYKEIVAALEGKTTLVEAVNQIKIATHRYAKRQRTWFRKDKRIHWIHADTASTDELREMALDILASPTLDIPPKGDSHD